MQNTDFSKLSQHSNEKIEEDDIVFFPSCMHHKQLKNNSQDIRYSLAFNFMPKGKTGRGDSVFNY